MTIKKRTWQTLAEPKYGKPFKILVWINGDFESFGHEVTLNPKYLRSWSSVLNFLTVLLQPRFGAVRKLYHLETKKMIDCLRPMKPNDKFIAVGSEKVRFKKNGYLTEEERTRSHKKKISKDFIQLEDDKSIFNFIAYTKKKKRLVIYVMVSGRACQEPVKVVLTEADLQVWNMVLEYLSYQLDVEEGVQYLCKTNGKIVFTPNELLHGELYVAIPFNNRFVKIDYKRLFSELRPPKRVFSRKPRQSHTSATFPTRKFKSKKQISPSLAVFAGSVAGLSAQGRCLSAKCLQNDCRLFPKPLSNSSVEVQTVISTVSVKSHQPLPSEFFYSDEDGDKSISVIDTNFEAYKQKLQEQSEVSDKEDSYDEDEEEYEVGTFASDMELIRSILDEIIDACVLELEDEGVITPPHLSISEESVPRSDKMFVPDPEDRKSRESLQYVKEHVAVADCCRARVWSESQRPLTTFAEIAKNKEQQQMSLVADRRTSKTSIGSNDIDGEYNKSVSFSETRHLLPHQDTIYEANELVGSSVDTTRHLQKSPKNSILKIKALPPGKYQGSMKNMHDSDDDLHPKFKLNVRTEHESLSELDEDDSETQRLYEELKRSASFSRKPRDSIMVTAARLSKIGHLFSNKLTTGTQKNLEDSGENDKSIQAFEDDEPGNREKYDRKRRSSDLYHRRSIDYSDIYENYDPRGRGSVDSEDKIKRVSFEDSRIVQYSNCCENRVMADNPHSVIDTRGREKDALRNADYNHEERSSKNYNKNELNEVNKPNKVFIKNDGSNHNNRAKNGNTKNKVSIKNDGSIQNNQNNGNTTNKVFIEKDGSKLSGERPAESENKEGMKSAKLKCHRENCEHFSCSEICLTNCENTTCDK